MSRKARGAKGRLASPAQIARLEKELRIRITVSLSWAQYRYMMRAHLHQFSDASKEFAAYAHQAKKQGGACRGGWPAEG
jgi:hypothetical protein